MGTMAVVGMCLADLLVEEVIDHGSQMLSFEIQSYVCPKATPPMGCFSPKAECWRDTQVPGRHLCQWALLEGLAQAFALCEMQGSLGCFPPRISLALSFPHGLMTILTFSDSLFPFTGAFSLIKSLHI